jgi:hypothetical protein
MKLKTHAVFREQLDTIEDEVGLLWFMVITNGHQRVERIAITKPESVEQLSSHFTPEEYKFIKIQNQMPVFKKL